MKRAVLLWLVCLGVSWAAPVEEGGPEAASCTDPVVLGAAREAMDKINKDRTEGYVFSLRNLANAHTQKHGENSIMFYLTMNVLETNCSVVSRAHFKDCEVRDLSSTPVYGQCKAAIFISRVNRVVRLYKYNCVVRPAAPEKIQRICPDCPSLIDKDNAVIKKTVTESLEKFNKESGLPKHFVLLQVTRSTASLGMGMMYFVQYTIQETTCANGPEKPEDCLPLDCEFAHKGFCKASYIQGMMPSPEEDGVGQMSVNCEIYEPEAAEKEKKLHLLGGEMDHSHNDTQAQGAADQQQQDHSHDHSHGLHKHSHSHGHGHAHAHHDAAHDHSNDHPHQHHNYEHAAGVTTHHHDHEMALDHDHKHPHLHPEHEHHHHHHHGPDHHQTTPDHRVQGMWRQTPALEAAVTLPAFPDVPAGPEVGVTLPLKPDPQIPGQIEPTVGPFPTEVSAECPLPAIIDENDFVANLFVDDPEFTVGA